jgi:hypothetical protein
MPCNECRAHVPYARAFDRVLDSLERRYQKLHRAWDRNPTAENTAAVNAVRLTMNQASDEYNRAREEAAEARKS